MSYPKKIEINKSSLVSLKAELLRKQDEVNKAKHSSKHQMENFVPSSKFHKEKHEGEKSKPEDITGKRDSEEAEAIRKSKEALEKKTILYDHLSQSTSKESSTEHFLVNFEKKNKEDNVHDTKEDSSSLVDSDEEWVDYVDSLGRTRRCHKTDLEYIQHKDQKLKEYLEGRREANVPVVKKWVPEGEAAINEELQSPDAYKEALRLQWEKKEQELMNKDNVHYEDVRFNEARSHGVGFYSLSGEAEERARQQSELAQARRETEQARTAAAEARASREAALQARLKAARARQRQRAGLPPEEEEPKPSVTALLLDFVEEQKVVAGQKAAEEARRVRDAKEEEAKKEREKYIREWDLGKEQPSHWKHVEMTQEQWVDKRRTERVQEFAPFEETASSSTSKHAKSFDDKGFFYDPHGNWEKPNKNTKRTFANEPQPSGLVENKKQMLEQVKQKYSSTPSSSSTSFDPVPIVNECSDDEDIEGDDRKRCRDRNKVGAEIEPPSTYEYFGPSEKKARSMDDPKININEAFEKGVKYLAEQAACKDKTRNRTFLDNM